MAIIIFIRSSDDGASRLRFKLINGSENILAALVISFCTILKIFLYNVFLR